MSTVWQEGDVLVPLRIPEVRADLMRSMARILDDPNQIHLDSSFVRSVGLGDRVINQGPTNCGYVMNMLMLAVPGAEISRFSARFLANVFGGDSLVAGGTVRSVRKNGSCVELECEAWLENGEAVRVLEAGATLSLGRASQA